MPTQTPAAREIAFLVYPECQMATVLGLGDLLAIASDFSVAQGGPALRISHWTAGACGVVVRQEAGSDTGHPDVVVVPGRRSGPLEGEAAQPYIAWLSALRALGVSLAANCGGAFLLGQAGLLDGRAATTHWAFAEDFARRFPKVRLDCDRILIDDSRIITTGGVMAWVDLGMHLVARFLGEDVQAQTGRFMLVDIVAREQRHYATFSPRLNHGDAAVLKVQRWLAALGARRQGEVGVPDMARKAGLEERTFLRRFKAATRVTPTQYVQQMRLETARQLLATTHKPIEEVAWETGYGDGAAFRRFFQRLTGLPPSQYRRRFGQGRSDAQAA
jgi:transcriptional regulator GlxA family with amidase domain